MPYFTKLPVTIQAVQFDGNVKSLDEFPLSEVMNWITGSDEQGPYILIPTLEGTMRASKGDFIIKGVFGEYYPCKSDIFYRTYLPIVKNVTSDED